MENFYLILVAVLFILAISDLIVGVSNDAVNFLNSAIGSKAAPFKVIMIVAALGILVGTTFSSGLMEVARKGIFNPEYFYFSEIIIIFLAVMLTDVILLDMYNTFGLPTSTTVSIVFELLGAAVAISILKIVAAGDDAQSLATFINSSKSMAIILGILLSVVIAFSAGAIVQYLTRLLFSFDYKKYLKYYGALWGGIAITSITYFILIKGAKGASFITPETLDWITSHTIAILVVSFAGWTILLQLLSWIVKLNILKLIVIVGTFALAMAFAGNDLVNFIGVPLAGLESYKAFIANPGADPNFFLMEALAGKVQTPTILLLLAGIIMVVTLWKSKKSRTVTKTEVDLGRQFEGAERFGSNIFSRAIVRSSRNTSNNILKIMPDSLRKGIDSRFTKLKSEMPGNKRANIPSFDLLRASVNLVVASIIISFATSMKLPLSTTYVTFMVAMGTSLSDRAWGRESAVYRVSGVLTVIAGWFLTAFSAFASAFLMAMLISYGGMIAVTILIILAAYMVFRTHRIFKKREEKSSEKSMVTDETDTLSQTTVMKKCSLNVINTLSFLSKAYEETITALEKEDLKKLKLIYKEIKRLNRDTKESKDELHITISKLQDDSIETSHYYVQVLDFLREIAHCSSFICKPILDHIDNNHKGLIPEQIEEAVKLKMNVSQIITEIQKTIIEEKFINTNKLIAFQHEIIKQIEVYRKNQVKRIKRNEVGTKNSMLYFNILNETKNLLLNAINLLKSFRDFVRFSNNNNSK
ncbi:MAG: inorganic phosphate transporter [Bacteroidales bacterium]|nr:inorganic phosphate transporter [Bacteroidales bacterium]